MTRLAIAAALIAMLAAPATAQKIDARAMLVASSPAKDGVVTAGTDTIDLAFAEPAELISVTLRLPDDSEMEAEPADGERGKRKTQFRYRLPAPIAQPGSYSLSYLLVSRSFKSLNGFIDFRIEGEVVPPSAEAIAEPATKESE